MSTREHIHHRLERRRAQSVSSWDNERRHEDEIWSETTVECGWGRLIFGQTFNDPQHLAKCLQEERPGKRDVAMYLRDPHVVLSYAPQDLFLDPSHTFRLWLDRYQYSHRRPKGFIIRLLNSHSDADAVHRLYASRRMVPPSPEFIFGQRTSRTVQFWVAQDEQDGGILGCVNGIDHVDAFGDVERGASLWALAVDAQAPYPGIGETLVRQVAEFYQARGRSFLDLSVMHDNKGAIRLYEKLGFERVPVFALKNKNAYNEPLFIGRRPEAKLNPYAAIIVNEARRRGIGIEVIDAEAGYFALGLGGRRIVCRESLSELTTAVAMSRCDDKSVTQRLLRRAGLKVPEQSSHEALDQSEAFLSKHGSVVVKPARGEQGAGISVDIRDPNDLERAIKLARRVCENVILEQFCEGSDLRIIVIDFEVVAAAVRRPAQVIGTGAHNIGELIQIQSRRRRSATGGESSIPVDDETERCIREAGYKMEDILPYGETLLVRKTANLHTGGTIHDVTADLSPVLAQAACKAARALDIPVTGLDFLVPDVKGSEYVIIEANERPGLANHEPQPTSERFVDLLFPQTATRGAPRLKHLRIDNEYLLDILLKLLFTPSPSGYTDRVVHLVCEELERLDVPFELTRRGAIRATLKGEAERPNKAIVAHIDTLGAMVKGLKPNGRLQLVPVGHWNARFAEGARCTLFTDIGQHRGTILPLKASGHTFGPEIDKQAGGWENVEFRIDERVVDLHDLLQLGVHVGDFIAVDTSPEITATGFINSRHLDDKAGAALLLAAVKAVKGSGVALPVDCHPLFTISEEVGSGASAALHQDVAEMLTIDNGTTAPGQNSSEFGVTICMADMSGPFDYHLTHRVLQICQEFRIPHQRDVFKFYRSDSAAALEAGNDVRTALVTFGIDASHGYERIHQEALESVAELVAIYMQSPPLYARDRYDIGPRAGFPTLPG